MPCGGSARRRSPSDPPDSLRRRQPKSPSLAGLARSRPDGRRVRGPALGGDLLPTPATLAGGASATPVPGGCPPGPPIARTTRQAAVYVFLHTARNPATRGASLRALAGHHAIPGSRALTVWEPWARPWPLPREEKATRHARCIVAPATGSLCPNRR